MPTEITKIIERIKETTPQWVQQSRQNNKDYEALVMGKDYLTLLEKVEQRESEAQLKVRKKYSRNIVDLFERVMRPVDNIYSSTGGIIDIDVNDPKRFFELRSNVRNGVGLTKWLDTNWSTKLYLTDPNGLLVFDVKDDESVYLSYKSIQYIKNYKSQGQYVEWVLFEGERQTDKTEWYYIDSEYYYEIYQRGEDYTLVEQTKNPFRKVPAVIISDIECFGSEMRLSKIDNVFALCKEFLKDQSIKTIFKQLHGMPIFWRYAVPCNKCKGEGVINGQKCDSCDGQGYYVRKDISDGVTLPVPSSENSIKLAPDMAGYVVPPLDIWEQYNKELEFLELIVYKTIWGEKNVQDTQKTVIETITNAQPVINSLNKYADSAQIIDWALSELLVPIAYPTINDEKVKVTVSYGRNFILEAVSDLLKRYHEDKTNGDNSAILDRDLYEYIHAKYKHNPIMLKKELLRLEVEPYIHFTLDQVRENISVQEAQKKILFAEFWKTVDVNNKTAIQLKIEFENYLKLSLTINTTTDENV